MAMDPWRSMTMPTPRSDIPLLSIVTINKNNATFLPRTLNSFAKSRHLAATEFIFVDGLSTDNSMEIARDFYTPGEMISEPDSGIYHAMNKGLRRSTGKYVLWINSGDQLSDNLDHFLDYFKHDYGMIAFGVEIAKEDCNGEKVEKICRPSLAQMPDGMIVHQGMALHRQTLLEHGGYNERWRFTSDFDILLRLYLAKVPMLCLPDVISRFYLGGLTSDLLGVARERLEILRANRAISRHRYWYRLMRNRADFLWQHLGGSLPL
jgi:glycosyltransferase involved in cell wall biosynthesis